MSSAPPETIALPNAVLGRIVEADGPDLAVAVRESLDHLRPWMPWASEAAAQVQQQTSRCREAQQSWDDGADYLYTLRDVDGVVLGTFGMHRRVGPGAIEIGYWMHVHHVRQGHATAATAALTRAALDLDDVERVEIHTDEANAASAAVPGRLGFRLDRVEVRAPQAPSESGRLQIWIMTR